MMFIIYKVALSRLAVHLHIRYVAFILNLSTSLLLHETVSRLLPGRVPLTSGPHPASESWLSAGGYNTQTQAKVQTACLSGLLSLLLTVLDCQTRTAPPLHCRTPAQTQREANHLWQTAPSLSMCRGWVELDGLRCWLWRCTKWTNASTNSLSVGVVKLPAVMLTESQTTNICVMGCEHRVKCKNTFCLNKGRLQSIFSTLN